MKTQDADVTFNWFYHFNSTERDSSTTNDLFILLLFLSVSISFFCWIETIIFWRMSVTKQWTLSVTLEHKSSHKQPYGYICSNSQKYIVWVKMIDFSFMPKIIRILRSCSMMIFCKFPSVNISKLNFWLVICIAKNLIWRTLKMIFSIFRIFCSLRFQIFK